jgi:hypothetical protein
MDKFLSANLTKPEIIILVFVHPAEASQNLPCFN